MRDIVERVMHPAHVPLVVEPKPTLIGWLRHAGPGSGFFGDQDRSRAAGVDGSAQLLKEADRFEVLPTAVDVGYPLAFGAAVVPVKHRGDGIHPEPVGVETLKPIERAGNQKGAYFGAAQIKNEGV